MPKIISLGLGAYVDAEQIVAVDDTHGLYAKSTILLKNGKTIFAYVKPETVKKRWEEAVKEPIPWVTCWPSAPTNDDPTPSE